MTDPGPEHVACDVLVIGGGLAGCWAAMHACEGGARVVLVDKGYISRAGCSPVCGGVSTAPQSSDDLTVWADEFIERGGFMNNQDWLEVFLAEQVDRISDLDKWGAPLIKDESGRLRRIRSRGMTDVRCFQFGTKGTMDVLRARLESLGCIIRDRIHIAELLIDDGRVTGAVGLHTRSGEPIVFEAGATVITAGPLNIKGRNVVDNVGADGHALAYRAGAELVDMEFAFGGTFSIMLKKYKFPAFNIALGHGGKLINARGERFMERYDPDRLERTELPQVIAAYLNENLSGRGPCYLDLRACDNSLVHDLALVKGRRWADELVTGRIKDYRSRPVLIEPQWTIWSHRCGIRIDLDGATTVAGLFAAGSVTKIEALGTHASAGAPTAFCGVAGARAGAAAARFVRGSDRPTAERAQVAAVLDRFSRTRARTGGALPNDVYRTIRNVLGSPLDCMILSASRIAEIRARAAELVEASADLAAADPHELVKCEETRNFLEIFQVCMAAAQERTESRESFYRSDFPYANNAEWFCWHRAYRTAEGPAFRRDRIPTDRYRRQPPALPDTVLSPIARNLEEAGFGARAA